MTGQWRGTGGGGLAQWMFTTAISELHCVNKWREPNWREARSQPHRHAGWDGDKDPEASFVPSLLGTRENAEPPHVPHPSRLREPGRWHVWHDDGRAPEVRAACDSHVLCRPRPVHPRIRSVQRLHREHAGRAGHAAAHRQDEPLGPARGAAGGARPGESRWALFPALGATRESPSSREARGTRVTTLRTKLLHQLFPLSCLFFLL